MSKAKCSNSNLNNKNNLASVFLKQRLAQFDREQKYSIYHIERSKVSTNHFLTQIKQCDNFLTTGSLELLGRTKVKKQDEVDSDACAQKPPSGHSKKSKSPVKRGTPSSPMLMGTYITPKLKEKLQTLSAVRDEWYQEGLKKRETSFQRGEKFLEKLREKERYFEELRNSSDDEDDYNPLLRNAKSSITRLPSFRKPSTRPYSSDDRTSRSRKSTDRGTIKRHGSIIKRLDSTFENLSIDEEPTSKSEVNVKFPRVTECRPSVAWQGNEIEEADDEDEEDDPPEDMMREFLNLKMKVKPKPLHSRIDEFYCKLDDMKKRKEERERSLPYYEKRRKWLMLTRGKVDDFDEDY
ncbi:hypothetical protein LOTGIDRAFT_228372 [Lottia gigantea]|uniref:Uncharacterized protein n=1 Tax=Lottia gigantea TaxID=225164 RepID=V4AKZ3_LOTGI|nr:hypothetical protein LOTGIDRAFT_228372 [Lottia gigantea]ESO97817.1 hypothetical protein LOTGIDRAFT_228372 [Lottia gigantea]